MSKRLALSMLMLAGGGIAVPAATAATAPVLSAPAQGASHPTNAPPVVAPPVAAPPVTAPTLTDSRGLSCTANDRSVREIVIDFTGGRWRDAGGDWNKIAAQDDATITLVNQGGGMLGGILSGLRRVEKLDRATLMLSTQLHTGLLDEARSYRCQIVAPFDGKRQI